MKIIEEQKLDFKDVLIVPKRTKSISRSEIVLDRTFKYSKDKTLTCVPIIASNMSTIGTFSMAKELAKFHCMTALHKHLYLDDIVKFYQSYGKDCPNYITKYVFYTLGITDTDIERLHHFVNNIPTVENVCVDCANGYSDQYVEKVKRIRNIVPNAFLMAGNVVTPNMVEELILNAGVNVLKAGLGNGSCCTTRLQTGVGYPQLSCLLECSDAAHGLNGYICSDGGCTTPGDVCKAFGAGTDFCLLGGMLSGHDECEQDIIEKNDKKYMKFFGMSSKEAQEKFNGGLADYKSAEGKSVLIPYKGKVENTIKDILGGIRSSCTYIGATSLKNYSKCCTFIKTTVQENKIFNGFETNNS